MSAMVLAHINEFARAFHYLEGCFHNCLRTAHKGDHRTVGGFSGVHVEQFHSL